MPQLDPAAAAAEYADRVIHPAFFDRLAERGYVPDGEKQAAMYLHMGADLAARRATARRKSASARAALVNRAYADYCRQVGIAPAVDAPADAAAAAKSAASEKAAAAFAADPDALAAAAARLRAAAGGA